MSDQVLIDLEIESFTARSNASKLTAALESSVKVADTALRRIEQLQKQRRRLARHSLDQLDRLRLALRLIRYQEQTIVKMQVAIRDPYTTIKHLEEQVQHLQCENQKLSDAAQARKSADAIDFNGAQESAFDLDQEIKRLRSHRQILARHLRRSLISKRRLERVFLELGRAFDAPLHSSLRGLWALFRPLVMPIIGRIERIVLAPFFGWRGSRQVQEALNG